jgi:hypothetical protein
VIERVLPSPLGNAHRGRAIATWILAVVLAVRLLQATLVLLNPVGTAETADGIPLGSYPAQASATIVALFALTGLYRWTFLIVGVAVVWRYRAAVPAMLALLAAQGLAALAVLQAYPLPRVGNPPADAVNLALLAATLLGLLAALCPFGARRRAADPPAPT